MSKQVNALVIIGHSHMIAGEAPHYTHDDIHQDLWYVRNGKIQWYSGRPITEGDKTRLYAGEVLLQLGGLAASRYAHQLPERPYEPNPLRETALEVIDEISPFEAGEALRADFVIRGSNMSPTDRALPAMFDVALAADPSIEDELREKWHRAQAVHHRRGRIAIMAYDTSALLKGLGDLKMTEIAPDRATFDDALNVVSQSYNLGELADQAGILAQPKEVPYYQTFGTDRNELEMLASALEDLKSVSNAIA